MTFAETTLWDRRWPSEHRPSPLAPPTNWRQTTDEGNAYFVFAKRKIAHDVETCEHDVRNALRQYSTAIQYANGRADLLASNHKNILFVTTLGVLDVFATPVLRHYFLTEAMTSAAHAMAHGGSEEGAKDSAWIGDVLDKIFMVTRESVLDDQNIVSSHSGGAIQFLTSLVHRSSTQRHVRMTIALVLLNRTVERCASAMEDGNIYRTLSLIEERRELLKSVRAWSASSPITLNGFSKAVADVTDELDVMERLALAKRNLAHGKTLRDASVDEAIDMDLVFQSIDAFRAGVLACHGKHIDLEAELLSEMGYVFLNVLKLQEAAHKLFRACILCANACYPRNFSGLVWYKRAMDAVEKYQQDAQHVKSEADAAILKELEPDIKALKDNNENIVKILEFITKTYPGPTPFKQFVKAEVMNEDYCELAEKELFYLTLLKKILVQFHSDKCTGEPRKVQLLYNEITLILTGYINRSKGV